MKDGRYRRQHAKQQRVERKHAREVAKAAKRAKRAEAKEERASSSGTARGGVGMGGYTRERGGTPSMMVRVDHFRVFSEGL